MNPAITIPPPQAPAGPSATARRALLTLPARARHGRPARLAARTLAALAAAEAAAHSGAGPAPITGTLAGITAWYLTASRADLAPPAARGGASPGTPILAGIRRASMSYVLAALRALHMDTPRTPASNSAPIPPTPPNTRPHRAHTAQARR